MRIRKVSDRYKVECFAGEKVNGTARQWMSCLNRLRGSREGRHWGYPTGMGYDGAKGFLQ